MMLEKPDTDDGLQLVYDLLIADDVIKQHCYSEDDGFRIRFFEYPETANMSDNWIVLDSITNEMPVYYADETWVAYDYLLHLEVWSRSRVENRLIANHIRDLLWKKLKFKQNDDIDEYDVGIYRDARRFTGTLHRSDLELI